MKRQPIAATAQPAQKGFTAWSFSRLRRYASCPLSAKLEHLDKIVPPESPQMTRGSDVHTLAADYITGKTKRLPDALLLFKDLIVDLRTQFAREGVMVEDSWAFRQDWSVTDWNDWDGCWLRIKVDAARLDDDHLDVLDWKTGKFSPQYNVAEYEDQIELYSLGALLMFGRKIPTLTVSPHLIYLDHGVVHPATPVVYTMADLPRLQKAWAKRVQPMMNDRMFPANPGKQCTWCAYSASKPGPVGGRCKF